MDVPAAKLGKDERCRAGHQCRGRWGIRWRERGLQPPLLCMLYTDGVIVVGEIAFGVVLCLEHDVVAQDTGLQHRHSSAECYEKAGRKEREALLRAIRPSHHARRLERHRNRVNRDPSSRIDRRAHRHCPTAPERKVGIRRDCGTKKSAGRKQEPATSRQSAGDGRAVLTPTPGPDTKPKIFSQTEYLLYVYRNEYDKPNPLSTRVNTAQ